MADNPDQRRLQALLQFATNAGSHGSEPMPPGGTASSTDRSWLNEAMNHYTSDEFNPVFQIKQRLHVINHYVKREENKIVEGDEISAEDVYNSLEEISDNCDHYDLARDLHKIGGFDVMIHSMQHKDPEICWRACEVLAVAAQNHEYCQDALVEMEALPIIFKLIDDTSAESKVREKAFYAMSCIVRGNENALKQLNENDGFSVLIRAMQSDIPKLKVKSVFFIKSLCENDSKYIEIFHELGIEEQIVGMLRTQELDNNSDNLNIIENLLSCLCTFVLMSEELKRECREPRFELLSTLKDLKKKFLSMGNEYEECIKFCDLIIETCFTEGAATAMDR